MFSKCCMIFCLISYAYAQNNLQFTFHREVKGDGRPTTVEASTTVHALRSRPTTVYKPSSLDHIHNGIARNGQSPALDWIRTDIEGPDIEDRHTLSQLARMTGNAYAIPGQSNWYDLDAAWNIVSPQEILTLLSVTILTARRVSPLAGKIPTTDSAVMYSSHQITPLLCSPLKGQHSRGKRPRKTNITTTCTHLFMT